MAIEKPASRVEELLLGIYNNGGGGGGGTATCYWNTTEYWNSQTETPSERGALYIYTNYDTDAQGLVPALKIGDGVHTVPALRFIGAGSAAMITDEDVENWDNKVTANIDPEDPENIVISH